MNRICIEGLVATILFIWSFCNCIVNDEISWDAFYPLTIGALIQTVIVFFLSIGNLPPLS